MMWMAWRAKIESLTVVCDGFLEILHLSQLHKAGLNSAGEVIEGQGAIWMAWRVKIENLTVVCDGFLEILHLSQLLEAGPNSIGKVIEG
jgi:hypothetical protein